LGGEHTVSLLSGGKTVTSLYRRLPKTIWLRKKTERWQRPVESHEDMAGLRGPIHSHKCEAVQLGPGNWGNPCTRGENLGKVGRAFGLRGL